VPENSGSDWIHLSAYLKKSYGITALLGHLPNLSLDKPSPANLTDPDLEDFYHVSLYLGRFCGIINCKGMGGGGLENGDCEKFTSFENHQFCTYSWE